ncbi:MAG: hypothetical protein Roseis2KO_26560 [Roseivirga sp.]
MEYTRDVNTTFLKHIDTERATLDNIFRKASKAGYDLKEIEHGVIAEFKKLGKDYFFVFTSNPDSLRTKAEITQVTDNVYWANTNYWRNLN